MVHSSRTRPVLLVALPLALVVAACGTEAGRAPAPGDAGLWAEVEGLDTQAFREAWRHVQARDHGRTTRVEQLDETGRPVAFREWVVRFTAADSQDVVVRTDSSGGFRFGMLDAFAADGAGAPRPVDLAPYVLPDDAPYLSARNREKYQVARLPDSTAFGRPLQRIQVRALPGPGDAEPVRRVLYVLVGEGREILAVQTEREDAALLFTERSRAYAGMRPDEAGVLLPSVSWYETWIRPRFGKDRRFRITTTWMPGDLQDREPTGPAGAESQGSPPAAPEPGAPSGPRPTARRP
jgi:hypothetical protein